MFEWNFSATAIQDVLNTTISITEEKGMITDFFQ